MRTDTYDGAVARTQKDRSDSTREAVAVAARQVIAERGFGLASIAEIAESAGCSKGALYHHYKDKTALLAAAYENLEQEITSAIMAAASGVAEPVESLRAGCHQVVALCADPEVRRLALIDAPAGLGWQRWREIDARYGFGLLKAGLQMAGAAGRIPADHLDERAHLLLAIMMEGALMVGASTEPDETASVVAQLIDQYLDSMLDSKPIRPKP